MKKFLALVCVGVMALGATVMASPSPTACSVVAATPAVAETPSIETAAANMGLTVSEFSNNAVVSTPGISGTEAVGVPKGIIVNGKKVNYSLQVRKVSKQVAQSASAFANGKKVYNVVGFGNMPKGDVQFTIYCKSLKAGDKVSAYQLINGQWVKLTSVVRDNNIDVVVSGNGPVLVMGN